MRARDRVLFYPYCVLLLLLGALIIRTGWMGDDAFIPARSMANLVNGYGLRWNVADRVQVFTEPLWLFTITLFYLVTREAFITTIVVSIAVSLLAVIVLTRRISSSYAAAIAGLAALLSSKAFIDYTTSGLENALNYLLVALFCVVLFREATQLKALRLLVLIASLSAFNRLDTVLLFAPAIALVAWELWRVRATTVWNICRIGLTYSFPLWGWLLFATIYFGFIFPNTYYAKIYTGVPKLELWLQGLLYYANALNNDPITLVVIVVALAAAVSSRDARTLACAGGVGLYLLYIISFGGDFMSGRFFNVPLFFAVAWLTHRQLPRAAWLLLAVLFFGLGFLTPRPSLLADETYGAGAAWNFTFDSPSRDSAVDHRGIADERAAYFPGSGLLPVLRHDRYVPTFAWVAAGKEARKKGRHIVFYPTPGFYGYYAGPEVHIVDKFALGDALLSKLPIADKENWRIGHYDRGIPAGYIESLQTGSNRIEDPKVRELYRVIKILTQDPIWSGERFKEIAKMNLGFYSASIRSIDVSKSNEPPEYGTAFPLLRPDGKVEPNGFVFPEVTAGWGKEVDAEGAFWWATKDARLEFSVPPGNEGVSVVVPVQLFGKEAAVEFRLNGDLVRAEPLPASRPSRYVDMLIRAPLKTGKNVIDVIGAGEAVQPNPNDARALLFALAEPRWR